MAFNPLDLSGKTIVVTGASSGIGRQTALYLSKLGASLVICGRDERRLEEARSLLAPGDHLVAPFDLGAVQEIPSWLISLAVQTGPIYGLVHSAGVSKPQPIRAVTAESFNHLMNINVAAAFALVKGFREKTVFAPGAAIVFLSSVAGLVGQPANSLYSATKGALISMTRSMALELAREGIRVNCVAPAMVMTEMGEKLRRSYTDEQWTAIERMHPLGLGQPEDIAAAVAFLLAGSSRWITGTTLVVDGGYTAS